MLVLLVTHVPAVTDALMASQLGSFTIDAAWFLSGLALWWPVLAPPGIAGINEPLKIGYLFAATIVPDRAGGDAHVFGAAGVQAL